ncbi:hypothetical protein [Paludibaculum fermentans]|uniref:Uncharacterized protein n=1 Tax=Paludibaculum fermentans TaxID=1473598 RepID=A0A7S7NLM3_PALFE|nr:hypothetical protein [Paludibaculum fermentans]QOY85877.1 hypothetical protein IRI77_24060 [Paludibaculum fermentans]
MVQSGRGGQDGGFDTAEAHLDPAGVAIEGLNVTVLTEDPFARGVLVAAAVFETGVEEGAFAAIVEGEVALEHVPFEAEGMNGWIGQVLSAGFGDGPEVGFDAGRHAVAGAVDSGAAGIFGDFGFALCSARAGGFLGVGPVGGKALFRDLGKGHDVVLSSILGVGVRAQLG